MSERSPRDAGVETPLRPPGSARDVPLCVLLGGGLVPNSVVAEGALAAVHRRPSLLLQLPVWLLRGRAHVRDVVEGRVDVDAELLPYDAAVLDALRAAREDGRRLVLVAQAPGPWAAAVAGHLDLFDDVVTVDVAGVRGATEALTRRYGVEGFDMLVPHGSATRAGVGGRDVVVAAPGDGPSRLRSLVRAVRVHQWLKNLLVFLPVLGSQRFGEWPVLLHATLAFVAFSMIASSVYVVNDLLDLRHDRRHPRKRRRPFASGTLPLAWAPWMVVVMTGLAVLAATLLPTPELFGVLAVYLAVTFAYSLKLKGAVLIDVITLAGLYTLRVIAGSAATGIEPSVWLLGFSLFFFLSLAMLKRYAELHAKVEAGREIDDGRLPGRSYRPGDLPVLIALGVGTGCVAVLVLALYVISDEFAQHYSHPYVLWQLCPLLLYWIGRAWIVVNRNEMDEDPVVWAITDQLSRWVWILAVAILLLAR